MGAPQWIMLTFIGLNMLGGFLLDGTPRKNPNWDGSAMVMGALASLAILGWGGFFSH